MTVGAGGSNPGACQPPDRTVLALPGHATPYLAVPRLAKPGRALPGRALPRRGRPGLEPGTLPAALPAFCLTWPRLASPRQAMPSHARPCRAVPCHEPHTILAGGAGILPFVRRHGSVIPGPHTCRGPVSQCSHSTWHWPRTVVGRDLLP